MTSCYQIWISIMRTCPGHRFLSRHLLQWWFDHASWEGWFVRAHVYSLLVEDAVLWGSLQVLVDEDRGVSHNKVNRSGAAADCPCVPPAQGEHMQAVEIASSNYRGSEVTAACMSGILVRRESTYNDELWGDSCHAGYIIWQTVALKEHQVITFDMGVLAE